MANKNDKNAENGCNGAKEVTDSYTKNNSSGSEDDRVKMYGANGTDDAGGAKGTNNHKRKNVKNESDERARSKQDGAKPTNNRSASGTNDSGARDGVQEKPKAFTIKYKRPRGSRACVVCRSRKVRCDAEIHIPCTNCITFGCECKLPEAKRRGNLSSDAKRLKLNPPPENEAEDGVVFKKASGVTSASSAGLEKSNPIFNSQSVLNISQVSVTPLASSNNNPMSRHVEGRSSITFFGASSIGSVAQKVGENHLQLSDDLFDKEETSLDSVEFEILKLRGAFLLPSRELSSDLIDSYFEHVHPLMPVVNRTEFMRKFDDPNDSPSLMLLQAVLLCGCRVSSNPLLLDSKGSTKLACLTFFRRAKALYEANYESDPISIIQTLILIGSYGEGPEDVTKNSFYWTRVAISLAQGFGFQRDITTSKSLSESDKKVWRRIWWCLFEKDRNVAIAFGRPSIIDLNDCDVPMLTIDDFNEDEPGYKSPYPVNKTQALYFIHLVKLAEITGIIIKNQYSVRAELMRSRNKLSIIQHCDMLMGVWFSNLPPQLVLSLNDPSTQNFYSCILNAQYYNRLYLIHRSNLLKMAKTGSSNPNNYKYPSWGISFQAARMISILSKILLDKNEVKYCPIMFIYIIFTALVMLIYHIDSQNQAIATTASDSLFILRAVMRELAKYWPMAKVLCKLFDKHANDKIKRANVIERGTQIAEYQEKAATVNETKKPFGMYLSNESNMEHTAMNNATSQDSIATSFNNETQTQTAASPSLIMSGVSPGGTVYAGKADSSLEKEGNETNKRRGARLTESHRTNSTDSIAHKNKRVSDESPTSSALSFPDISLVTESLPKNNTFFQNFDPTQLFPESNFSLAPSRRQSADRINEINSGNSANIEFNDTDNPLNEYSSQLEADNKLLNTNFMDSSFINMNVQLGTENHFLSDDISNLFNMHI